MTLEYNSDVEPKNESTNTKQRSSVTSVSEGKPLKDKIKPSPYTPKEPEIETPPNNKNGEIKKTDLIKKEERENEKPEPKKKKVRTQNQIDATNKMREALKARRDANLKIKETV